MTSFRNYNANIPQHLSSEESEALKNLSANCNLIIQKVNKGNSVALVKKDVYIRHTEKILDDTTKFEKVKIKKRILIQKSGSLTTDQYKKIKAFGSGLGILYGLCNIKLSLMFVRHLDLYFRRLGLLVINLQSF